MERQEVFVKSKTDRTSPRIPNERIPMVSTPVSPYPDLFCDLFLWATQKQKATEQNAKCTG